MKREVERIADQLQRAFRGPAWHGPAVMEALASVTAAQAAARPIAGAHSIWEIAVHIAVWDDAVVGRLNGKRMDLPPHEDWPPVIDTSEAAWAGVLRLLGRNHNALRAAILNVNDDRLDTPILDGMSSTYVTLHGAVQHDIYHAGQIALLARSLTQRERD